MRSVLSASDRKMLWTHGSGDARRSEEIFRASAPGALALFAAFLLAYAGGPAPSEKKHSELEKRGGDFVDHPPKCGKERSGRESGTSYSLARSALTVA